MQKNCLYAQESGYLIQKSQMYNWCDMNKEKFHLPVINVLASEHEKEDKDKEGAIQRIWFG